MSRRSAHLLLCLPVLKTASFPVGANIDGVADYSLTFAFNDVTKQSRKWGSAHTPWDGNCSLDPTGNWPAQSNFGNVFVTVVGDPLASTTPLIAGNWSISFTGQAVVSPVSDMASGSIVVDSLYDPHTDTSTATLVVPPGAGGCNCIQLSFTNASTRAFGPGLRSIRVLQPGAGDGTGTFSAPLLSLLARFSVLRFMDWAATNGNLASEWSDRTPPDASTYAGSAGRRVPWETIFELANTLAVDPWINVPINATDDYVTQLATLAHQRLAPGLHLFVELSNEVWNWGFSQTTLNFQAANASVCLDGDPHHFNASNLEGNGNPGYWMMYRYTWRSMRVAELFGAVYGMENVGRRRTVRPVWAWQEGDGFNHDLMLLWLTTQTQYTSPTAVVDSLAIAPYITAGDVTNDPTLTVDDMFSGWTSWAANISVNGPNGMGGANFVAPLSAVAGFWGLGLHAYEAGPDTVEGIDTGPPLWAKANASLDARMEPLLEGYLHDWYALGPHVGCMNIFTAGAGDVDSRYGIYTILYDMTKQTTPKLLGINAAIASPPPPLTPLIPLLPGVLNASFFAGHPNPPTPDGFTGWPVFLNYPVSAESAFQARVTVTAGTDNSGNVSLVLALGGDGVEAPDVRTITCPSSGDWAVYVNCTAAGGFTVRAGYSVIRIVRPKTAAPWIGSVIVEVDAS